MPKWKIVSSQPPKFLPDISNKAAVWFNAGRIMSVAGIPFDQIPLADAHVGPNAHLMVTWGLNSISEDGGSTRVAYIHADGTCWLSCRPDVRESDFEWIKG